MGNEVFISFIELKFDGGWSEITYSDELTIRETVNGRVFVAMGESDITIVEPEVIIRKFRIKASATVIVGNSVVSFDHEDIEDELSVDDKARVLDGKRLSFDGE